MGKDLTKLFDQYLKTVKVPVFEYKIEKENLSYRWSNCIDGFNMPIKIITDKDVWLNPTENWQTLPIGTSTITVDRNFFIVSRKM